MVLWVVVGCWCERIAEKKELRRGGLTNPRNGNFFKWGYSSDLHTTLNNSKFIIIIYYQPYQPTTTLPTQLQKLIIKINPNNKTKPKQ